MTKAVLPLLFLLAAGRAFADGFMAMPLKDVLLDTDTVILVEILENKGTTTLGGEDKNSHRELIRYTNHITARVISTHVGEFKGTEYETTYSLTLVKGVWLMIPGSGLEGRMAPGETYVLLLKLVDGKHALQRAEKGDKLQDVLRLRKELDDEDRRVAEEQARIPNGIYRFSDAPDARKIRLQDGYRVRIGEEWRVDLARKELRTRYNVILLSLTLGSGKPAPCVLVVRGKAYRLFDSHWAAREYPPRAEPPPSLYCSFADRKDAEPVAAFFGVAITNVPAPKAEEAAEK